MSSAEQEHKAERQIKAAPEQSAIGAQDAQAARNAGVSDLKAAEAIRTNQSDGSLRKFAQVDDQNMSIELVDYGIDGRYNVLASRVKAQEEVEQKQPDKPKVDDQSLTSTGAILAKEAEKNPALEPVKALYDWTKKQEPGAQTEAFKQLAREQLVQAEPKAKAALDALDRRRQAADEQEDCGVHELPKSAEKVIKGHVSYPEKEIEGVKRLTPEDFSKLAKAFEKAGPAAQESIKETSDEILRRTAEGYKDTVLCGVNAVVGLLAYDRDLMLNPAKARETAAGAGEVFGLLLYNGAVMSIKTGAYAQTVRQSGDYSLPLKHLPQVLNKWYESLSPADQMAIIAGVTGGLHLNQSAKEVQKLRQPGAFTEFLQEAVDLLPRNPEAERRAMDVLSRLVVRAEPLAQKVGAAGAKANDVVKEVKEKGFKDYIMEMSPFFEKGKKKPLKGVSERAAELTGLPEEQVKKLVKNDPDALERLTGGKLIYMEKEYREIYLQANPHYRNYSKPFDVHHRIPQDLLTRHPDWFSHKEIHDAKNLVGIPRSTRAHSLINQEWRRFWDAYPNATKQDLLKKVTEIDKQYGADYLP